MDPEPAAGSPRSVSAVAAHGLTKRYRGSGRGIVGLDFEVAQGSIFALLGPNGAGKTTFVKCLLDLLRPGSGAVTIFGVSAGDPDSRRGVGFAPEAPRFPGYLSPREVMRLHGWLIGLHGRPLEQQIDSRLSAAGLESPPRRVREFSKGMVRRLALAQAMLGEPRLLVLDEPTADLDPIGRRAVRNQLAEFKEAGGTVILNSHMLSEVERLCDSAAILNEGRQLAAGPLGELVPEGTDLETAFVDMVSRAGR